MAAFIDRKPAQIAFLAGAGISIPPPSALPSATAFITAFTDAVTADRGLREIIASRVFASGAEKRFEGDFLRFESLMSCVKLAVDPEVSILRIYGGCASPNAYHFFLADQLMQGAIVLTTNFDNLIEIACREKGVNYSLVVSDAELAAFAADPARFKNPLVKLHGGIDLVDSTGVKRPGPVNIKTTLEQVGRVYLDGGSPQLTSALAAVTGLRHLVIIGYSGCDDFDIMPCLMKQTPREGFTWIDHGDPPAVIFKHGCGGLPDSPPYRLLAAHGNGPLDVKIVRGNTAAILGIDLGRVPGGERFDWKRAFERWSQEHLATAAQKQLVLGIIFTNVEQYEKSIQIFENIPTQPLSPRQLAVLYFSMSNLYVYLNDHDRAINSLSEMAQSDLEIDGFSLKGFAYYCLARINTFMEQYNEAEFYLEAAIAIFTKIKDGVRLSDSLHELGRIRLGKGDVDAAMRHFKDSIQFSDMTGDMRGNAIGLAEIARALSSAGKPDEAESYARKAIQVCEINGFQAGLGIAHHALGYIFSQRGDSAAAADEFRQAIVFERSSGDRLDLGHSLHSLGDMYASLNELDKAQECAEESLRIKNEIHDEQGIANTKLLIQAIALKRYLA